MLERVKPNQTKPKGEVNVGLCRVIFKMHLALNGMLFFSVDPFNCVFVFISFSFFFLHLYFRWFNVSEWFRKMLHHHFVMRQGIDRFFFVFFLLLLSFCHWNGKKTHSRQIVLMAHNQNIYPQITKKKNHHILWDLIGRHNISRMHDKPNRIETNKEQNLNWRMDDATIITG